MRTLLLVVLFLETVALLALGGAHVFGMLDEYRVPQQEAPVFTVPAYEAAIGDLVRYQRLDKKTGEPRGYLEYFVQAAIEYKGSQRGRELRLRITETDAAGRSRQRLMVVLPRAVAHGFLPPRYEEEDDYPAGARPIVKRIRSETIGQRYDFAAGAWKPRRPVPGFVIDTVTPRDSITEVRERFWMTPTIPIFGVSRWERDDEVLVVHRAEFGRDSAPQGEGS